MEKREDLILTKHAIERYIERTKKLFNVERVYDPEYKLQNLFKNSRKVNIRKEEKIRRLIRHLDSGNVDYYVISGWRLVVAENTLITIERIKKEEN